VQCLCSELEVRSPGAPTLGLIQRPAESEQPRSCLCAFKPAAEGAFEVDPPPRAALMLVLDVFDSSHRQDAPALRGRGSPHAEADTHALAIENNVFVIRADVAGRADGIVPYGSSGIVDSHGNVLQSVQAMTEEVIVEDLDVSMATR
jgi:hypothetical protein